MSAGLERASCPTCHGEGKVTLVGPVGVLRLLVRAANVFVDDVNGFFYTQHVKSTYGTDLGPGFTMAGALLLALSIIGTILLVIIALTYHSGTGFSYDRRPFGLILALVLTSGVWASWCGMLWARSIWRRVRRTL